MSQSRYGLAGAVAHPLLPDQEKYARPARKNPQYVQFGVSGEVFGGYGHRRVAA